METDMETAVAPESAQSPAKNPNLARGVLVAKGGEWIIVGVPGTGYEIRLGVLRQPDVEVGKKIAGTIRLDARRVDVVKTGGRYIEPLVGRPRRVQGDVVAVDSTNRTVTVNATVPIVAKLARGQSPDQFKSGDFVAFDCMPDASFTVG